MEIKKINKYYKISMQLNYKQKIEKQFKIKNKCPYCGHIDANADHIEKCKKDTPLISVIIPSRVGEEIKSLESLRNQTYQNIETIIEYDEKQEGASVVRNRGARKAKGKFLFFCDNDLVLNPNCLSDLYLKLKSNLDAGWAFGKFYIDEVLRNENKNLEIPSEITVDWIEYFHGMSTMSLIRADINPVFDEEIRKYNDWDLWLNLNSQGHYPVFCDEVLFCTYNKENGISTPDEEKRIIWTNKLYEKYKVFVFRDVMNKNNEIKNLKKENNNLKKEMMNNNFWLKEIKRKIKFAIFSPGKFFRKYTKIFLNSIFGGKYDSFVIDRRYLKQKKEFDADIQKKGNPRVLVLINHYYSNKNASEFPGKSTTQEKEIRKNIVEKVINELRRIPNVDVKICGIKGCSIFDIDQDFSHIENPAFLVYSSIEWMFTQIDNYDYFVNIEDDILLTKETFQEIVEFDKTHSINECYHPNRMEYDENGVEYCTDFKARPGWEKHLMEYKGIKLRVAKNPHSGLAIFSKPKMLYAKDNVDLGRREIIIGYYMASAFANVNAPFLLYRSYSDLSKHKVIHLDNWEER